MAIVCFSGILVRIASGVLQGEKIMLFGVCGNCF